MFDDLSRACVVTERIQRTAHLTEPLLAVRQVHGADGLEVVEIGAVTGKHGPVAKQLLQLAQRFGTQEGGALRVTHDLTQEEIAQLVGASRETVNKALADFAHRGWIRLEGKSVLISDSERLARRAR